MTAVRVSEHFAFRDEQELEGHMRAIRLSWSIKPPETTQLAVVDRDKLTVTVYAKVRTGEAA